jgi:hypothetical protein
MVLLDFSVVRTEAKKGGLFSKKGANASSAERPKREPTWEDRLVACQRGGKTRFDLSRLQLTAKQGGFPTQILSPALGLGPCLVALNLKGNGLVALPPFLSTAVPKLTSLVLSLNGLSELPEDMALLVDLEVLAIDRNRFVSLPAVLFSAALCESLVTLNAQSNQLAFLPPEIQKWLGLENLLLANNALTTEGLPTAAFAALAEEGSLENLELDGNPCMRGTPFALPPPGDSRSADKAANKTAAKKTKGEAKAWLPPDSVAELLGARTLFRSKAQRQVAMQRAVALRKRLAARRADLVFEE